MVGKPLQPKVQRWASCRLANIWAVFCIELRVSTERMLATAGIHPFFLISHHERRATFCAPTGGVAGLGSAHRGWSLR